jgi:hypothetical protein
LTAFRAYSVAVLDDTQDPTCESVGSYLFAPACRYVQSANKREAIQEALDVYLGEKVVSENEYLSAMAGYGAFGKLEREF